MYPYSSQLYSQFMPTLQPLQPQPQPQEVIKVNGRAGAESYQLPPNSSVLMLDNTAPIVWLSVSDGAGYKVLTPYDIKEHEEVKQEDELKKLADRITKLEDRLDNAANSKPYNQDAKQQRKSDNREQ